MICPFWLENPLWSPRIARRSKRLGTATSGPSWATIARARCKWCPRRRWLSGPMDWTMASWWTSDRPRPSPCRWSVVKSLHPAVLPVMWEVRTWHRTEKNWPMFDVLGASWMDFLDIKNKINMKELWTTGHGVADAPKDTLIGRFFDDLVSRFEGGDVVLFKTPKRKPQPYFSTCWFVWVWWKQKNVLFITCY